MKNLFCCLLLAVFILSGCDDISTNNGGIGNNNGEKTYQLHTYRCYKDKIDNCKSDDWEEQRQASQVTFTKDELNNFKFSNLSDENKKIIINLNNEVKGNGEILLDGNNATISNKLQSCKVYDISLDITYFDWSSGEEGELNKYIMDNRIQKLRNFLEGDNSDNLKIKEGDKINLRFIGTMKENNSQANLKDSVEFYYKTPCISEDVMYTVIDDDYEVNNIRGIINYYYILGKSTEKGENKSDVVSDMNELINKVKDEFNKRYGSMSVGTYLLDHFNETLSEYREGQINIILSDFFFQLSETDKNILKKKYCNRAGEYCADSIYQFSLDNVKSKYIDKYFFKSLFTKYIFEEFPSLNNICPTNQKGEKMNVYLFGIESIPGLSVQDKVKDYYSNYLLKNCNVKYK